MNRTQALITALSTPVVYILNSKKLNRYYIGFSENFELRLIFHENAEARKFTSKSDDWEVFLVIDCNSKAQGLQVEKHLKKMKSKVYIENLKNYPEIIDKLKKRYC